MYNAVEEAKAQVKEIIMGALGRLVGEGKLPAEPLPPFQVTIPAEQQPRRFLREHRAGVREGAEKQSPRCRADDS